MNFCNMCRQHFTPADRAKLPKENFDINKDRDKVPYSIFTFDVLDKFGFYWVTYAKWGCRSGPNTKLLRPQSCCNYMSAVRTYYRNHHLFLILHVFVALVH